MLRTGQPRLPIGVRHRRQIPAQQLEVGAEAHVVGGHLEHAQVQVCDGREGAAGDQEQRGLVGVVHGAPEAVLGDGIVGGWGGGVGGRHGEEK